MQIHLITIKICIVWVTNRFIKSQSSPRHYSRPMAHDRHPMQAWLSVKKNYVPIFQMAVNYTTEFQFLCNLFSVATYQKF
uniref:DNA-directed RNA polymerase subunit n=1 Tax=Rhizophora mucronata TaxID=61149 RepID=A0A2P2LRS5_RHIMU